ncbi:adenylate/guanylate cyclase domain-containing protein [bacterium]|nr:adenylate/guanylate cyclase domain-containing protein [bacterium]
MSDVLNSRVPMRKDFMCRVVRFNEVHGTFDVSLLPNPELCQWVEVDGKRHLQFKDDGQLYTEAEIARYATELFDAQYGTGGQQHAPGAGYDGLQQDLEELASPLIAAPAADVQHQYLSDLGINELDFVILSVDIAGSTKLATSLGRDKYTHLIMLALDEIGAPIPEFNGKVLKYTGDGLIAYFAEPHYAMENDLVLDCALAIREVVYGLLNDFLESSGFPRIELRIGIDSGIASVVTLGSAQTKQETDLIGATVSLAAKMQQLAQAGNVLVGEMAYQRLQPHWQARCSEIRLPLEWEYSNQAGGRYSVYNLELADPAAGHN